MARYHALVHPAGQAAAERVHRTFLNHLHGVYNRTVRYDWLAHYLFDSIDAVQEFATRWRWSYHHERPNMALGGITPQQKLAMAA